MGQGDGCDQHRGALQIVHLEGIPLHPRHMAQIDQIAEMTQAEILLLEVFL